MPNTLVNPWMLFALVAMTIPLIIEWLFRRRRQRIAFPAMRYLMNPKKRRRVRLQDLILLLLRTVVPGVLVLALARPLFRPQAGSSGDEAPRHVVLVLDGTYSMGQSIGQTTAFQVAQTMAQDVVRGLPKGVLLTFVYLGGSAEIVKKQTSDRDSVHDAIGRARVSDQAGRMADAIETVEKLLSEPGTLAPEVYLISDLQRSTWAPTGEDARDATALLGQLGRRAEPFVLDTGGENGFNAYLVRFEPREKVLAVGMDTRFEVDIEAKNMPADGKLWLTLYADEDKTDLTASKSAQKPGKVFTRELGAAELRGGRATVAFNHTFVEPGEHLLRVELEGDALTTDNQRFYLASVPANVEVLIIDRQHVSTPTADPFTTGSGHLRNAVAPHTPPGFERLSPFAVTVRRPEEVLQLNLEQYAVVILANVGNPGESLVSRLEQYVSDGGKLLIFAGDSVAPYDYNTQLLRGGKGLLPCELVEAVGLLPEEAARQASTSPEKSAQLLQGLSWSLGGAEPHPAVGNVRQLTRQPAPSGISRSMRIKLSNKQGDLGRAVAFYTNQQPAVCEKSFGQGKAMFVTTSADASWNYHVYTGEYIVLVQELVRYLVGSPDRAVNLQLGQPFEQSVLISSQYLPLRRPDFRKVRVPPVPQGKAWSITYRDTDRQGIYEVDAPPGVMARRRFVVNLSATEGDLSRLDIALWRREMSQAGVTYWGPDKPILRAVESHYSVREYAWLALWTLLLLLALETWCAVRFGRRRV